MSASAIYLGRVSHARSAPRAHAFSYAMSMLYLDLDELATMPSSTWLGIEAARPLSFRRADYLGDAKRPLKECVQDEVQRVLGFRPDGPIRLLTQVRAFGYAFNPVSFYYCFDATGEALRAIVAEITNTPWGERHRYVLAGNDAGAHASFAKAFHVSPFFPMDQKYDWKFVVPGERLQVSMTNLEQGRAVFHAKLALERAPLTAPALAKVALRLLPMGWGVHAAIYFQALRLWWKGTPFFPHPALSVPRHAQEKLP
jgi:DUF1365 family protein